jgi:hypothetical protein
MGFAFVMMCLFYAPVSLFAQNTPLTLNYQSSPLLKGAPPFQHDLEKPQTFTVTPVGLNTQSATIGYGQFFAPLDRPIYTLIKDEALIYEYWQELKNQASRTALTATNKQKNLTVDRRVFNALYNKRKLDEKKLIRMAWKKVFGLDVWYPYYKAKEIEDWVKERFSLRIHGFKGRPKFENDQILYVFKKKF